MTKTGKEGQDPWVEKSMEEPVEEEILEIPSKESRPDKAMGKDAYSEILGGADQGRARREGDRGREDGEPGEDEGMEGRVMLQDQRIEVDPEVPGNKVEMGAGKTKTAPVGAWTMEVLERWRSPVELKDLRTQVQLQTRKSMVEPGG